MKTKARKPLGKQALGQLIGHLVCCRSVNPMERAEVLFPPSKGREEECSFLETRGGIFEGPQKRHLPAILAGCYLLDWSIDSGVPFSRPNISAPHQGRRCLSCRCGCPVILESIKVLNLMTFPTIARAMFQLLAPRSDTLEGRQHHTHDEHVSPLTCCHSGYFHFLCSSSFLSERIWVTFLCFEPIPAKLMILIAICNPDSPFVQSKAINWGRRLRA